MKLAERKARLEEVVKLGATIKDLETQLGHIDGHISYWNSRRAEKLKHCEEYVKQQLEESARKILEATASRDGLVQQLIETKNKLEELIIIAGL